MAWIQIRVDLQDDPAVFRIASLTNLDRYSVLGRLVIFWTWVDRHSVDGRVDAVDDQLVDHIASHVGFAAALRAVGWLKVADAGIEIPNHERHMGNSSKARALKNARQARWRARVAANNEAPSDSETETATETSTASTGASTRGEESREEKEKNKTSARERAITLRDWLAARADGERILPDDDPIRAWARDVGIDGDWLRYAWEEFRAKYTAADSKPSKKRYVDWRATFRGAVRENWARLWFANDSGGWQLTSAGIAAERAFKAKEKRGE